MSAMVNGLTQTAESSLTPNMPPAVSPSVDRPRTMSAIKKPTHLSRPQILDATEICLVAEGYDGTTIRRIARQLGCAVGSIYRYFTDKRQLLAAVVQRRFEPVETATQAGLAMDQVFGMYARIAGEQPEQYRLMFWLSSVGQTQTGRHLPEIIEQLITLWAERLADQRQAELQWAQLHGNLMLGLTNRQTPITADIPTHLTEETPTFAPAAKAAEDLTLL